MIKSKYTWKETIEDYLVLENGEVKKRFNKYAEDYARTMSVDYIRKLRETEKQNVSNL